MFVHVNGIRVVAAGTSKTVCSNSSATYGGEFHLLGQIERDGSFTLRSPALPSLAGLTIVGKVPPPGSTSWDGTYTFNKTSTDVSPCVIDQVGSFTSSPLSPLPGAFSGQVNRAYPWPPLKGASLDYLNKTSRRINVSIAVAQGAAVFNETTRWLPYAYLPLSGTIQIVGCPCFTHGTTVSNTDNRIQGEAVRMSFKMDDESELIVSAYYTSPATGLSFLSHVRDGKCAGLAFTGTLLLP